ncbi:RNA methyltransferase [Aggregatimonas sangjinii]|uniref:RNA methyltransferase n=1 Tax=Aggregatimonas sangjinii TaxID=2583587 RepID=A0A5B7SPD6_9FLAO|nr:RNA methyltransferase [Aggregatimonas sangjinii]QCX00525.1 RNA methyltransferase [Aggregatimonas sangjinii]
MNEVKKISSLQNPLVKKVLLLKDKARERKKSGLFVLEGRRELQLAIKGDYEVSTLLSCETLVSEAEVRVLIDGLKRRPQLVTISKEVYQKIAYRETTEGIVALAKSKLHTLEDVVLENKNPLVLVAEAPEKPGNIGALLRTADAANVDAVLIANPKGDLYNPNTIRSSIGCVFTTTIGLGSTSEIIAFLKSNGVGIFCAALTASKNYTDIDFNASTAIVVGTEATGLSQEWLQHSTQNIIIPMRGEIDSMNVSVSAAILVFEALRQRELKGSK